MRTENDRPAVIDPTLWYRLDEAQRVLGVKEWAWRKLRQQGLQVVRLGNRRFVSGESIIGLLKLRARREEE